MGFTIQHIVLKTTPDKTHKVKPHRAGGASAGGMAWAQRGFAHIYGLASGLQKGVTTGIHIATGVLQDFRH